MERRVLIFLLVAAPIAIAAGLAGTTGVVWQPIAGTALLS